MRVWAPRASAVDLVLENGDPRPMDRGDDGWWSTRTLPPGTRYRYSVDHGPLLPDPRSAWQPEGVDGWSATVDHAAFDWRDGEWHGPVPMAAAVVYELHVGTFTPEGTFDGVIAKLDHLRDLGVTHVELMPVNEFPGDRGWGYDGVLLWAPHHAYGGPEGLKRVVDACHQRGLAVVLDVVYNHLGPSGNHLASFGPYFTDRYVTPWGDAVNLDGPGSDEVRRFFVDNALMWLRDYHVDGLRLDAVHALLDTSATHLLEQLAVEVDSLAAHVGRSFQLIAESDLNDPRVVARREVGGYGVAAQWSDDFHHALHSVLTGEREGYYADFGGLGRLATALRQAYVYAGEHSPHRGRAHGRPPVGIPGWRFLGYLQNHDQIGNRATGDRVSASVSEGRLRIGAALVALGPFVPMLFMGEEWGTRRPFPYFTDHPDPELATAVREGRRREFEAFGWRPEDVPDPQDQATAASAILDWNTDGSGPDPEALAWWKQLLLMRRSYPELTDGRLDRVDVRCDETAGTLVVRRGRITLAANLGPRPEGVDVDRGAGSPRVLLAYPRDANPDALNVDSVVIMDNAPTVV